MNDEEQHCINWIRSGHSFYANEFDMKDNNGYPMNIAKAAFMQGLIIEPIKKDSEMTILKLIILIGSDQSNIMCVII